jgi:serine/threonine protein kinase
MVMLKEGGAVTAKIIDLGLAKTVDESASEGGISSPGAFAGTPEFASPEQFAGVGADIRSDLYSLGVTLSEMVIGQTPFRGTSAEVMYQHQHAPLPLVQLKDVPQPVLVLLELLLEKDPAQRFQTPNELLKAKPAITALSTHDVESHVRFCSGPTLTHLAPGHASRRQGLDRRRFLWPSCP